MLDCPRMQSRVHTILSILAEDHAPAALRPSILLAVDWPTVADDAASGHPADEDDVFIARAAGILMAGGTHTAPTPVATAMLAALAARLATVAASLTATADKSMARHAAALWGAAAALVVMPQPASMLEVRNTLAEEVKGHEHLTVMHMARAAVDMIGSLRNERDAAINERDHAYNVRDGFQNEMRVQ